MTMHERRPHKMFIQLKIKLETALFSKLNQFVMLLYKPGYGAPFFWEKIMNPVGFYL